jgi:tetratricopeptide (TPR) repeat protein
MISLPPAFTERMQQLLGTESEAFFQALVSESPTSIRLNPEKTPLTNLPFPEFVFALFNIANVYAKSGEIQKAIDMYTKVLEVDGDIAEAYFNRGLLHIYQGDRSAANVDLSKAGELGLTDSYSIIKRYCSVEEE